MTRSAEAPRTRIDNDTRLPAADYAAAMNLPAPDRLETNRHSPLGHPGHKRRRTIMRAGESFENCENAAISRPAGMSRKGIKPRMATALFSVNP
jgi:hypothetical protein